MLSDCLISLKKAGQMLDVSARTIRRMVDRGELSGFIKVGRLTKVRMSDIEAYMQNQKVCYSR